MNATPPVQYGDFTVDPFTGLSIPKTYAGNVAWRRKTLVAAKSSGSLRRQIKAASAKSPIYWLNLFGWTFHQKIVDEDGHERSVTGEQTHFPFVTWKVQDDAIASLYDAITTGKDVLISKSRDMGASWLIVATFHWFWQFRPSSTFLELSRKQSLVDKRGDMDSLFEKHRYLIRWQPEWIRPQKIVDNLMHLENQDIGTTIEGESTNENAGQASRKTAILLDEFARVAEGEEIDLATTDTSSCRIFNSTPSGPNTQFTRIYRGLVAGTRSGVLLELPWWKHPFKGKGAELVLDLESGKQRWTSPWYKIEVKRRSKRNIAQNLDMEHGRAGDAFFDADEIEQHRAKFQAEPLQVGNIAWDVDTTEDVKLAVIRRFEAGLITWVPNGGRRVWRLWTHVFPDEKGRLRPNQLTRYIFGIDISAGTGASNSVITVLDHSTNMIVAKFWDAFTSPEELAEAAAFAAVWFGGVKPPLIVFEKNGPGGIFGKKLLKLGYPGIYYQKVDGTKTETVTQKWGWASSPARKELMLGQYREALKLGTIINPCREALDEALDYVYDDKGKIEPGTAGAESDGGTALHGDHVIADGLLVLGRANMPKNEPAVPAHAPRGSFGDRRRQHIRKVDDRNAWRN